jgi:predicted transcriptional regulator
MFTIEQINDVRDRLDSARTFTEYAAQGQMKRVAVGGRVCGDDGVEAARPFYALANRRERSYTFGMKTAVSIPNELFDLAERLARRTRKSRSRLFSDALREYVARRSPDKITEAMDQAVAEIGDSNDPFVAAASRRRLEQSEW